MNALKKFFKKFSRNLLFNPETKFDILDSENYPPQRVSDNILIGAKINEDMPILNIDPNFDVSSTQKKSLAYSFGVLKNKKNQRLFGQVGSTPASVGPNSYKPGYSVLSGVHKYPEVKFSKSPRMLQTRINYQNDSGQLNYSSIGKQVVSTKKTERNVTMVKARKDASFVGVCQKDVLKISLPHAVY